MLKGKVIGCEGRCKANLKDNAKPMCGNNTEPLSRVYWNGLSLARLSYFGRSVESQQPFRPIPMVVISIRSLHASWPVNDPRICSTPPWSPLCAYSYTWIRSIIVPMYQYSYKRFSTSLMHAANSVSLHFQAFKIN